VTVRAAVLAGVGSALPERAVDNVELAARLGVDTAWMESRTGIRARRIAAESESTTDLAVAAADRALAHAGGPAVSLVIVATTTPDRLCPATAPTVASRLGFAAAAFDVAAVCAGFIYALAAGAAFIEASLADGVLVIGADRFSAIVDPADVDTAPLFGDGAGAVVLRPGGPDDDGALHHFDLGSDGALADLIATAARTPAGSARAADPYLKMDGRATYRHAISRMTSSARAVLKSAGWSAGDVDHVVAHQANVRILKAVAQNLDVPFDRLAVNLERLGNTAAASIPLALDDLVGTGAVRPGQRVLLTAFGGGAAWGSAAFRWPRMTREVRST
jgi:3-oxoacyl-[acyl-carrier-protein] synthase-3